MRRLEHPLGEGLRLVIPNARYEGGALVGDALIYNGGAEPLYENFVTLSDHRSHRSFVVGLMEDMPDRADVGAMVAGIAVAFETWGYEPWETLTGRAVVLGADAPGDVTDHLGPGRRITVRDVREESGAYLRAAVQRWHDDLPGPKVDVLFGSDVDEYKKAERLVVDRVYMRDLRERVHAAFFGHPNNSEVSALSRYRVSAFPSGSFPEPLRQLIAEGAKALDAPPEYIGTAALVFAAGCIGRSYCIELKPGYRQFAILYACCVGLPGSGKSPGQSLARKPIDRLQADAMRLYKEALARYESDLADRKFADAGVRGASLSKPRLEHFYSTDPTVESLATMLESSAGLTNARDELAGWIKSMDAYRGGKGGDRQRWLSGWSADPLKIDRKSGEPIFITHPTISVVGGIQPDVLPELQHEAGSRDGFLERILWAYPEAPLPGWTEDTVDDALVETVYCQFAALRRPLTEDGPAVITLSAEAKALFVTWHDINVSQVGRSEGLLQGVYAKLPQQLARITLVLHCLLWGEQAATAPVAPEVMEQAIALVEYFREQAHRVLPIFGQPDTATSSPRSRIHAFLRSAGGAWVPRSALRDELHRNISSAELGEILRQLEFEGLIERNKERAGRPGRPPEEWRSIDNAETRKRDNAETSPDEDIAEGGC